MEIGELIKKARKRVGWRLEDLGKAIGLSMSSMSAYENDKIKGGADTGTLCKIADALNDLSILVSHCQSCPVRKHIFLKQFPELNNIRRDPAIITARLRKELIEAAEAVDRLQERFTDKDFKSQPDYMEVFEREMEQVVDAERNIEILKFELILSGTHSSADMQRVYERQQQKCVDNGHHKPEEGAA